MKYLCEYSYVDNEKNKIKWVMLMDEPTEHKFDYGRCSAKPKVLAEYPADAWVKLMD